MRIFLFGNGGSITSILERLVSSDHEVVGICGRHISWSLGVKTRLYNFLVRSGLWPRDDFFYRNVFDDEPPLQKIATKYNIEWYKSAELKTERFELKLRSLAPDLCLVASFHRLIPANIISVPRLGIVNFHPSLLPKHRGGTPNRWVLKNGETMTGITAHILTSQFDTGDVIAQVAENIEESDTWGNVERRLAKIAASVAIQLVNDIGDNGLVGSPQNEEEATYEPAFRREHQFIDWSGSALEVMRTCNAMRPKSGGLTWLRGSVRCLWDTRVAKEVNDGFGGDVGKIISFDDEGNPVVCCGEGRLCIKSFLDRGRVLPSAKILSRYGIVVGARFNSGSLNS